MTDTHQTPRPPLSHLLIDRLVQPQFILALVSGGFLWWLSYRLLGASIPENARELVAALVGFISGQMVGPAWQFFLGTTQASEKKTGALADNAAVLRRTGDLPGGEPQPVIVKNDPAAPVPVAEAPPPAEEPK
jgi:hypothetical protein